MVDESGVLVRELPPFRLASLSVLMLTLTMAPRI